MQQGWGPNMQVPMTAAAGAQMQQQSGVQPFVPQPKKPRRRVLTSILLEVFVYFGGLWDIFYYILNILVFVWKGKQLGRPELGLGAAVYVGRCVSNLGSRCPSMCKVPMES